MEIVKKLEFVLSVSAPEKRLLLKLPTLQSAEHIFKTPAVCLPLNFTVFMLLKDCTQIYTLGPQGTFSDEASKKVVKTGVRVAYTGTFAEALAKVTEDLSSAAVVPVENSVAGTVAQVQDSLVSNDLIILGEINLLIEYSLLASAELDQIEACFAHPQALEQSSGFITKNLG